VTPGLEGYADRLLQTTGGEERRRLAEECAEVDRLVAGNGHLRAALTDTAVSPGARRAVMEDLLADRVSPLTRRLVAFAVAAVPAPEVPGALSWVATQTRRAHEGQRQEASGLGRRAARARVGGYASALFEDLSLEDLEELEDALFRLARTIESTAALRGALTDRDLPASVRSGLVRQLLEHKVPATTLELVTYVVEAGRPRDVVGTLDWLVERTAAVRGWRVARVHAAHGIEPGQRQALSESLGRLAGASVDLEITVEPELLGGVVVEIGDLLVDASARGRLERLREHLAPGGWENELGPQRNGTTEGAPG
jgi:F-type H+-transporting ATPase subunit delta